MLAVSLRVGEHVDERTTHRPRRRECATVPAFCEELAPSEKQAIDSPCQTDVEPANTFDQIAMTPRFHEQMEVVRLNREVHDLEPAAAAAIRSVDGAAHRRKNVLRAKRAAEQAESDVLRIASTMLRPRSMRRRTPLPRLTPSAPPRATPPIRKSQRELPRVIASHLTTLTISAPKLNIGNVDSNRFQILNRAELGLRVSVSHRRCCGAEHDAEQRFAASYPPRRAPHVTSRHTSESMVRP